MSNFNFDGQPDGDWDDRGDLSWKEYDWQQYLARHEQEVEKFMDLYNRLKDQPEHLDEVAHQMGWDAEDWSVADDTDEEDSIASDSEEEEEAGSDFDPYTLLRHPVFVVFRGLYRYLRRMWSHYMIDGESRADARASWAYAQILGEGEMHSTLALQSLDMGDYQLAVCELKLALEDINNTFSILPALLPGRSPDEELMRQEIRVRLFDMRELCLRVLNDCREQLRRRGQ